MGVRAVQQSSSGGIAIGGAISNGTDTRVLFDDNGTVGEDAGLTYNKTSDTLNAGILTSSSHVFATTDIRAGAGNSFYWNGRSDLRSGADGTIQFSNNAATGFSTALWGPSGGATSKAVVQKKVTGIADNSATAVITVTIPNANHAAGIEINLVSSNGSTDAFESTRVAKGFVVLARTTGVDTVPAVAALALAQIATVGSGATHTLAYGVSAVSGASSTTQTFTITVTIDDSGNLGSNQVVVEAKLINAEATGVSIA